RKAVCRCSAQRSDGRSGPLRNQTVPVEWDGNVALWLVAWVEIGAAHGAAAERHKYAGCSMSREHKNKPPISAIWKVACGRSAVHHASGASTPSDPLHLGCFGQLRHHLC